MTGYHFDPQDYEELQNIIDFASGMVATPFDASKSYAVGEYCRRESGFYVRNIAGSGAWDASKWTPTTVGDVLKAANAEISALNATLTNITTSETASFTDNNTGFTVSARKRGGILQVQLSGQITISATGWITLGTLPASFRPSYNLPYFTIMCQGTLTHHLLLSIYSNGQVRVNASATLSNVYFNDGCTFVAD